MFKAFKKELLWGGRPLVLETGKIARQADAAVMATYGGTTVLCTVVAARTANPDVDFFPLSVHYQEKTFAVGRIPGGFFKREGRPSEKEVLTSRLIDRPIRPLFAEGFKNETQVICTVLSHDLENDPDIVAMIGTSAALTLSGLPFLGPIGSARVARIGDQFVLNPTAQQMKESVLDLVVAGTRDGVLMVESEAHELPEDVMLDAVMFGQKAYQDVISAIIGLAEMAAREPWELSDTSGETKELQTKIQKQWGKAIVVAYAIPAKAERVQRLAACKAEVLAHFSDTPTVRVTEAFKKVEADGVRQAILKTGKRIDGRDTKTIRPIDCEVGVLPRAHGSALFTRGETQALVVATLGTGQDEQIIDALDGEYRENFLLHYNFPPYSVGEVGRVSSPGRREIGHGRLAWRAIHPMLPSKEKFPYTIRVVSEITESNGSSSMATVCGSSLSLMDAGVPLAEPVAGIAMGLIKEGKEFAVLSDILGDEDHLGDMDFKVAGTRKGITALQMDIKITSITEAIMKTALEQAHHGRLHILEQMNKAISASRSELTSNAPRIVTFTIPKDKIREVIGSGGKVIREICEVSGAKVDIEDDGTIRVAGTSPESIDIAVQRIKGIACDPVINEVYSGKVVKIMEFGAFVNFMGNRDGLVHISELSAKRPEKVGDVVKVGDDVRVKVIGFDDRGKIKLSMKALAEEDAGTEFSAASAS